MKIIASVLLVTAFACGLLLVSCRSTATRTATIPASQPQSSSAAAQQGSPVIQTDIGFRAKRNLDEHYDKHGSEFGAISKAEYLRLAQSLRDRPAGGDVLESKRADGVATRFDRKSGAFLAFNDDLTIRTFFKPNDGEAYFRRQLKRSH
ncbi:MAG: hypothetical protein U0Z53_19545 [Blastocatellia bacterium]